MAHWFLIREGKEEGPFDDVQLRKLAADGMLNPSDIVRRDGSATGGPANKIKGLFTLPTSEKLVATKRPPPPPSRLGVRATTSTQSATASQVVPPPIPAAPSQVGAPAPVLAAQTERRLNPNVMFILGIWVGLGLCAAAFTGLAITGRFAPLVAWLETAAQKETKQEEREQPKPEWPDPPKETPEEVAKQPDAEGEESPSAPGTLTAEFYPYQEGVRQQWDIHAFLPGGTEWLQSANHSFIGNGVIRSVTTQHLGKVDGKTMDMLAAVPKLKEPKDTFYRQKDGFIETSSGEEKDPDKVLWKRLVKLGVKPGDEWEDAHGFEKFKLLRFEKKRLNIKGTVTTDDVLVAVIEESLMGRVAEHELAYGIGPIGLKAWRLDGGKKTLMADHTLVAQSGEPPVADSEPTGRPLPPSARKIFAKTGTATSTNPSSVVHRLNRQIENLEVHATNEDLIIDFGVDVSGQWPALPSKLLVRLFDQNGKYLTHFVTEEAFTPRTDVYQPLKQRWDQVQAAGARGNYIKPFLLLHQGNRIVYGVNARDLRDTDAVEVGFMAP